MEFEQELNILDDLILKYIYPMMEELERIESKEGKMDLSKPFRETILPAAIFWTDAYSVFIDGGEKEDFLYSFKSTGLEKFKIKK